jgi:hypothetical protein
MTTRRDAFDHEMNWISEFTSRYGINPARGFEMYLEISRHFENKREREKTAREARKWAELQSFANRQTKPEAAQ